MLGLITITMGLMMFLISKMSDLKWLPGDIVIKRKNFVFIFPITTMIILSVILTIVLNIIGRFFK
jgi:phosphotransferase system  glucose/maltose/N-acetylglucosamine-specific IIC component